MGTVHLIRRLSGFTLLELLITVAIIAILAGIAVPHLLEAQVRAKVAHVHKGLATMAVAQEAYHVDHNRYPPSLTLIHVTTPIAYLSQLPQDRFRTRDMRQELQSRNPELSYYEYVAEDPEQAQVAADYLSYNPPFYPDRSGFGQPVPARWLYKSWGPNGRDDSTRRYDPTNGTVSDGDIARFGP